MSNWFKHTAISILTIWLAVFALLPLCLVLLASFLKSGQVDLFQMQLTLSNYTHLFSMIYANIFLRSLAFASITAVCCLLIAYPFAYAMSRLSEKWQMFCLLLIIIPFWTSSLIRAYAIITILKTQGVLNHLLLSLGLIHQPMHLLYTSFASQVGLIYCLLPFMVLPLFVVLEKFDWRIVEAARDLGANQWRVFWKVVVPISMPGIMAGILLVLLPAMTLFYIPDMLGGAKSILLGNVIKSEFLELHNWPQGSAISVLLTALMAVLLLLYWLKTNKKQRQGLL